MTELTPGAIPSILTHIRTTLDLKYMQFKELEAWETCSLKLHWGNRKIIWEHDLVHMSAPYSRQPHWNFKKIIL
jgi:hypothetical protein